MSLTRNLRFSTMARYDWFLGGRSVDVFFVFDLDGTLLDPSARYYAIYRDLLAAGGASPLPMAQYWDLKRAHCPEVEILARSGCAHLAETYLPRRLVCLENRRYLRYDQLIEVNVSFLRELYAKKNALFLVTLRRQVQNLNWQLEHLGLTSYFDEVVTAPARDIPAYQAKVRAVTNLLPPQQKGWFIGDTETDILAGQAMGCRTLAVCTGIRNRTLLAPNQPTLLLPDLSKVNLPDLGLS